MSKSEWASDRQGKAMIRRGLGPKINLMQSSGLRLWSGAVFIIIVLIVIFLTGRPMWQPDGNQVLANSALSNTLHSTLNFVFDFCNICFSSTKDWSQVAAEHGLDQTGAYCGNSELQLERAEVAWLFFYFSCFNGFFQVYFHEGAKGEWNWMNWGHHESYHPLFWFGWLSEINEMKVHNTHQKK